MIPGPKVSCTLQTNSPAISGTGSTASWSTVCTFNAMFAPIRTSEQRLMDDDVVLATHRVMVDRRMVSAYTGSLTEDAQIVIDSIAYGIVAVQDYNGGMLGRHYEIMLKRVA